MSRNIMEAENPKEVNSAGDFAVDNRCEPRTSRFEALGIPDPQVDCEPEKYKVLFEPAYALQPENYPDGGVQKFYGDCFKRLQDQQAELPNASAKQVLGWMHNNTVLGACTEYRCSKVVQRHIADQSMKKDGYLDVPDMDA